MSSCKSKSKSSGKKKHNLDQNKNALKNDWNECASVKSMIIDLGSSNQGIWKYDIVSDSIRLILPLSSWSNAQLRPYLHCEW